LMPALWPALLGKNLVAPLPDAIRHFLAERARAGGGTHYRLALESSYRQNTERNAAIRAQATTVLAALNAAAIEVALLKGTRLVLDKRTPFSQGRVLGDIDLLVPAEKWKRAGSILEGTGYRRGGAAPHAITYVAANGGVEVDLHRDPLWLHRPLPL